MLSLMDTFGPATHAAPPILAQSSCPVPRLAPEMIFCQGGPPLCQGRVPLDNLLPVSSRNTVGSDLSKEGSYNGCLQLGLGRSAGGPSGVRLLVNPGGVLAYQLPRDVSSFLSPQELPPSLEGAPRLGPEQKLAQRSPLRFSPDSPDPSGHREDQGDRMLTPSSGPPLEEPDLVSRADTALSSRAMAHSTEEGSPLSGQGHDMAYRTRVVEPSCLVPQRELDQLSER
ncbi:hypothetical protein M9458_001714, partial [Cirrhinus mrigala]